MKTITHIIKDEVGIHARPAGELVKLASGFESGITITFGEKTVDAKRIIGLMTLGAKTGAELTVTFDGADEDAATHAFEDFFKTNL